MKNRARSISVLLVLLALAPAGSVAHESHGGMSGGGGNVLPGRAPDAPANGELIEHAVKHSRGVAVSYLQELRLKFLNGDVSAEKRALLERAFSGSSDLATVARGIRVEVEDDRPCFDFQDNAVDGSIRSDKPNRICISSHSIAAKVHRSEVVAQSAALMIHEFSELIGFSEDEAVTLQSHALTDLLDHRY